MKPSADGNTKDVKIAVLLKYLSNFWRTFEMPLSNCKINLILTCSEDCAIFSEIVETKLKTTDTKPYVRFVTLSTQHNARLLKQLKSAFKRTINWNKYLWKVSTEGQTPYLDYLTDPSFQGVNRLFVLSFDVDAVRKALTEYFFPKVEIKDFSVKIDGQSRLDEPVKNNMGTYDNIWNITTGQRDDYTTSGLLDFAYFKEHYKLIGLSNQALDADPKAIVKSNFTGNLVWAEGVSFFRNRRKSF